MAGSHARTPKKERGVDLHKIGFFGSHGKVFFLLTSPVLLGIEECGHIVQWDHLARGGNRHGMGRNGAEGN
eukprot:4677525-Prorocentrum_lima.AAC.1